MLTHYRIHTIFGMGIGLITSVATLKKLKSLDGPLKKSQKTPGQISIQLAYILGKKSNFSWKKSNFSWKKSNFSEKSVFSPPKLKFLKTFFFLCFSRQLSFLNFYPLIEQKLRKQKLIPYFFSKNFLLFSKNHLKICIFRENLKTPEKTLGNREKTPEP